MNGNGLNIITLLNGASKVLNIAKEAIPLYNKAKPIISSSKDIFSNINKNIKKQDEVINTKKSNKETINNNPTFFQ